MLTPVSINVQATVQPDGSATITQAHIATSETAVITATLDVLGNPTWTMFIGGTQAAYGIGPQVEMGPRLVAPNEKVVIVLQGALPGSQVTGQLHGGRSSNLDEVLSHANVVMPNIISMVTTAPRQALYPEGPQPAAGSPSFTVPIGGSVTKRFLLPTGCVQIRLIVNASGVVFNYAVGIVGVKSGSTYFPTFAPGAVGGLAAPMVPVTFAIDQEWDPEIDLTVGSDPTNTAVLNVRVSAIFEAESPGQSGSVQSVKLAGGSSQYTGYDFQVTAAFNAAGTPSVNQIGFAPPDNFFLCVAHVAASLLLLGGAAAATPQLQLVDSVAGIVHRDWYAQFAAPGIAPPYELFGGFAIFGDATWQWDRAIGANQFATLTMSGWFQEFTG